MTQEEKKVKVAWCTCGESILLVSALPYAETDKETVRDFFKLANSGHKIEYMLIETFKQSPFLTCECRKKRRNDTTTKEHSRD